MLNPHSVVARFLAASGFEREALGVKYDPAYPPVQKKAKELEKLSASYEKLYDVFSNFCRKMPPRGGYVEHQKKKLDYAKRLVEAVQTVLSTFQRGAGYTESFLKERPNSRDLQAAYAKCEKSYDDLAKKSAESEANFERNAATPDQLDPYLFTSPGYVKSLNGAFQHFHDEMAYAAKQSIGPKGLDPNASPEDKFKAFFTPELVRAAKTVASKLKKDKTACMVCGLDVMEDVNAHSERRALGLEHYAKEMTDKLQSNDPAAEAQYDLISSMVGKVSSMLKWDVIGAGAFAVQMARECGAPEAGQMFGTLVKAYAPLFK